jgi:hypothetical protein
LIESVEDGKEVTLNTKRYLEQMAAMHERLRQHKRNALAGYRYTSIEAFLLAQGSSFIPAPLPKSVRKGRFKECFSDAHKLAMRTPERYVYCEGYADSGFLPVLHAWCLDLKRGVVVDRTWHDNRGQEYFGVPFRLDFVNHVILRTEVYGVLGNLWMLTSEQFNPLIVEPSQYRHPLLTGGN